MKQAGCLLIVLGLMLIQGLAAQSTEPNSNEKNKTSSIEWSFTGELNLAPSVLDGEPRVYDLLNTACRYDYDFFHVVADMSLVNDQKYSPLESYMFGRYFYLNNGGLVLDFDILTLQAGRFVHRDFIDSPYSLFISSRGLPAFLADITFSYGFFTYESRWIRLNTRSAHGYPDRGANYKVFAFQVGSFRFGLQDSAVYVGRVFDEEYFFSPIPHIFTQMAVKMDDTPWEEDTNDNAITGLFVEWEKPLFYLYAQWLVDDINLDFLIPGFLRDKFGDRRIASKMAWSLGGRYRFPFGRLGFYHAGATKFTFEGNSEEYPYSYTYFPASTYPLDGTDLTLDYLDNYIGYKYGENNLAFLLDYQTELRGVDLYGSLEYVISGSKSPANPWHEYETSSEAGRYTQLLNEAVLEHTVAVGLGAAWTWRAFTLYTRLRLGGVFNQLALEPAVDFGEDIFRPQPGEHRLVYRWTLGVRYLLNLPKAR